MPEFQCHFCDEHFTLSGDLTKHVQVVHKGGLENFVSDICDIMLRASQEAAPIVESLQWNVNQCRFCDQQFGSNWQLSLHAQVAHNKLQPLATDAYYGKETVQKAQSKPDVFESDKFPMSLYDCHACDKTFVSSWYLSEHIQAEHENLELVVDDHIDITPVADEVQVVPNESLKPFHCHFCSNRFNSKYCLSPDVQAVPIQCHICGNQFGARLCLNAHVRAVHDGVKALACDICSQGFWDEAHLNSHMEAKHKDPETFNCPSCEMKFRSEQFLSAHIRDVHENPKRFVCRKCGEKCTREEHFQHRSYYQDPKHCNMCDKSYASRSSLSKHYQAVHGQIKTRTFLSKSRTFTCVKCSKEFSQLHKLTNHKRICMLVHNQ